jgi:glycosyltransferase involved in cell wall biosynthesis
VTGDLIITLDADLQNPPEEIPRLVAKADEGYDVVGTVRQNRQDSCSASASKMINRLIQRTTGKAMGDTAACCAPTAATSSTRCSIAMSAARFPDSGEYLCPPGGGNPGDAPSANSAIPNTALCA